MYTVSLGAAELRMKDTYSNANAKLDIPSSATTAVLPYRRCLVEGSDTVESLKDKTIFVTGGDGDKCRKVAEM